MMGFGMGIGLLLLLLVLGLLILGAVWLAKSVFAGGTELEGLGTGRSPSTREILDQRYARGEITREEYERIRSDLGL